MAHVRARRQDCQGNASFLLTFFDEFHRKRVNTVPGVFRSVVLAFKHVAQMPVATGTQDFRPKAIRIGELLYSSFNLLIEGRPTAAGIKFTGRIVEWSVAAPAMRILIPIQSNTNHSVGG